MKKVPTIGAPVLYAYGRASTDQQQITLGAQEHACRANHQLRHDVGENWVWGGWFPDASVTAKIGFKERPMGEWILRHAKAGDMILVAKFDRIFRSIGDASETIDMLEERDIKINALDVQMDTRTAMGRMYIHFLAMLKQYERETISERTRDAQRHKKRIGSPVSQVSPIGWKITGRKRNARYIPDHENRRWGYEVVRRHEEEGKSFKRIATELYKEGDMRPTWKEISYLREVRLLFCACKLEWQKIFRPLIPSTSDLKQYLADHDGRPPLLEGLLERDCPLNSVPPKPRREPVSFEPADP